jgi:WD40 repeat protein
MELVNGRALADELRDAGGLRSRLALLPHLIAVTDAMAYAHSQGVIHRDLKPHNVLVGEFGETVVIDWGLAKDRGAADRPDRAATPLPTPTSDAELTRDGAVLGTPAYMPPEQADSRTVDARSDVYALGAILYHLLVGRPPYHDADGDVVAQVRAAPPAAIATLEPDAPRDLVAIAEKAMRRDPRERYPSARELADDLKRFQTGQIVGAYHYSMREIVARWLRRNRPTVIVAGVLIAIGVIAGALGIREIIARGRRAETERAAAVTRSEEARRRTAEALAEGARAALLRSDDLEARAKVRGSLEADDSLLARALWVQLEREPRAWKRDVGAAIYHVVFSPDGKTIAAACQDRSLYLFDTTTSAARVLRGQGDQVTGLAYAPDGATIATGAWSGDLGLWDLATGTVRKLHGHGAAVWGLAYSPDGRTLVSGSIDRTVKLWDVATGALLRTLEGHTAEVARVVISPDGTFVASASTDRTVRLWHLPSGEPRAVLTGHELGIGGADLSRDGKRLVTGSWDRTVRVWDIATATSTMVLRGHTEQVQAVRFSPDGSLIASAGSDRRIILWDAATGEALRVLPAHDDRVTDLDFSPDGRLLVSGGNDNSVQVWDLSRRGAKDVDHGHSLPIVGVAFSPDSSRIATSSYDLSVRVWDAASGRQEMVLTGHTQRIYDVVFSPDGKRLLSASGDQTVRVWDAITGAPLRHLEHGAAVYDVAISPDGSRAVSVGTDALGKVWDLASGALVGALVGHGDRIYDVGWSPDGRWIATGSYDTDVRVWDAARFTTHRTLEGHTDAVDGIAFTPDSKQLVSGSEDHTLRVWELATGASRVLGTHPGRVYRISISPDGRRVGGSGSDGTARLWDLVGGGFVSLVGHRGEVDDVAFSPDGRWVATASDDGTVRTWDAVTGHVAWKAPLLLARTLELYTHQGWVALGEPPAAAPAPAWRQALESRARSAAEDPASGTLCLRGDAGAIELWRTDGDRRIREEPVADVEDLLAIPSGCVVRAGRQALLIGATATTILRNDATAIAWDAGEVLVAGDGVLGRFAGDGTPLGELAGAQEVTAVRRIGAQVVVGFGNGNLEALAAARDVPFADVPSTPVVRLLAGPPGTVIAGYANGLVGIWALDNGARLYATRLHGAIAHLVVADDRLYAASELGDHTMLDLAPLTQDRCALLDDLWRAVPVAWENGLPVRRAPPADHPCAATR